MLWKKLNFLLNILFCLPYFYRVLFHPFILFFTDAISHLSVDVEDFFLSFYLRLHFYHSYRFLLPVLISDFVEVSLRYVMVPHCLLRSNWKHHFANSLTDRPHCKDLVTMLLDSEPALGSVRQHWFCCSHPSYSVGSKVVLPLFCHVSYHSFI